jgi:hypothetical protein
MPSRRPAGVRAPLHSSHQGRSRKSYFQDPQGSGNAGSGGQSDGAVGQRPRVVLRMIGALKTAQDHWFPDQWGSPRWSHPLGSAHRAGPRYPTTRRHGGP